MDPEYREKRKNDNKQWRLSHPGYMKEYFRNNMLQINGKTQKVKKRPRSTKCEICDKSWSRLNYHHWNNENTLYGIWICNPCHRIAEVVDCFENTKIKTNSNSKIYVIKILKYLQLKSILQKSI